MSVRLSTDDIADVQGLVLRAPRLGTMRHHVLCVRDAAAARAALGALAGGPDALRVTTGRDVARDAGYALFVGVTHAGLAALELPAAALETFPAEYRAGAAARDVVAGRGAERQPPARPDGWRPAFEPDRCHVVVTVYASDLQRLDAASGALRALAVEGGGFGDVGQVEAKRFTEPDGQLSRRVHFGFTDGISQPTIAGLDPAAFPHPKSPQSEVPPGMFVLGHPEPDGSLAASLAAAEKGEEPPASFSVITRQRVPEPAALGHNGTYGALLVAEQHVAEFEAFLESASRRLAADPATAHVTPELLAAKMCGRWRNGVPLALSPDSDRPSSDAGLNDFDYRGGGAGEVADPKGVRCPIGAHIRRTNPRGGDTQAALGDKIRIIRRGMPYGPDLVAGSAPDGVERGLAGLFLCVSLREQFEFIMHHWVQDGLFARGLDPAEDDPLVGYHGHGGTFTFALPAGRPVRVPGLSRFVTIRGAAYLFYPSLAGLRHLAALAPAGASAAPPPPAGRPTPCDTNPAYRRLAALPEPQLFGVLAARAASEMRGTRDAHPKHHGLVRARLEVGVDPAHPELARGLFARPASYEAYVRFSNSDPMVVLPDDEPDARGMAIKVLGVDGEKLGDETRTQDFILVTHPVFITPDVPTFACFQMTRGAIAAAVRRDVCARHGIRAGTPPPAVRREIRGIATERLAAIYPEMAIGRQLKTVESLATTTYWSETPYAHGPDGVAVKLLAVPSDERPDITRPGMSYDEAYQATLAHSTGDRDYLRHELVARLRRDEVRFTLRVQPQTDGDPVEDAVTEWRGPSYAVATLVLPRQTFDTEAQNTFGAHIAFDPWHCLRAHEPLGGINRFRRVLYPRVQRIRHAQWGVTPREPNGYDDFASAG